MHETQEQENLRQEKIYQIKAKLLKRFGTVFNIDTGEMEQRQWENINLMGNCGEISIITQKVIGGDRREIRITGENPTLYYGKETTEKLLVADGHIQANHAYVTDTQGNVWDPTLEIWGNLPEGDYLQYFSQK